MSNDKKRLKNKNIAPFAGTNLLLNKIEQLKKVKEVERKKKMMELFH